MPTSKRKVHTYVSADSVYAGVQEADTVSLEAAYAIPPWQRRMQEVATEASQRIGDPAAEESYVADQWKDYARLWAGSRYAKSQLVSDLLSSDPTLRLKAETDAQIQLMDSLAPEHIAAHEGHFKQKFAEEGAWKTGFKEYLQRRQRVGFAYSQNLRRDNPEWGDEEIKSKTTDFLRMQGFDAEEFKGRLPDVTMAPEEDDEAYWWTATKEVAVGLPANLIRGIAEMASTGWQGGLAIREAIADEERHGERLLAPPRDAYIGWERPLGMPTGQQEDNVYRLFRLAHAKQMEHIAPIPEVETFPGILASGIGRVIPQMVVMLSGAGAARGLALSGATVKAMATRASTIGVMFALEGSNAFPQYMQYAEEAGIDPHDASMTALVGAATYALAASALEYYGPFRFLEQRLPGIKRRLVAMALLGAVEGGTEFLQAVTQEAMAYGLDLREKTWENLQDSLQQAAMEGLIGGIVGGGAGAITFQSPIIERGVGDVIATDPKAAAAQAWQIVQGIGESPLPIDDVARLLITREEVTPEEAYAVPEEAVTPEVEPEVEPAVEPVEPVVEPVVEPAEIGSNEQLTSGQPLEALDETALPNTIQPEETPEQTMTRVVAGTLTESDEIDLPPEPASTPEEASRVEDIPDGTPDRTFLEGLIEMLKTEQGAIPLEDMSRAAVGGITGAAAEVSLLRGGIHSMLLDESAPLRTTDAGRETIALLDEAESRHLQMRGQLLPLYDEALATLPFKQRNAVRAWSYAMREDGQTNYSTMIEHPERVQNIPEGMDVVLEAYRTGVLEKLGDAAAAAKIPQLQYNRETKKWELAPFQRAEGGRYLRLYTRDGMDLMAFQEGHHLWDALVAWGQKYPDRNPDIDFTDSEKLRAQLDGAKKSGKTKKAGSLEFVRIFRELPVALKDKNGKWVSIQTRDPRAHYMGAVERQSRRIALWTVATEMLVPRYGKFNEKTGQMEFRQPNMHPEITDVDGLLARLRKDIANQAKSPKAAEVAFNKAIDNYERTNFGGYEHEFMTTLGETKARGALAAGYNITTASVLQLAPLFDVTNPLRAAGTVGWQAMLKGYGSAMTDMLLHPRKFGAEYQAMGAIIDGHVDWTVHKDTWFRDMFKRNVPQALMAVGRFTEVRGQFTVARIFDRWVQAMNNTGNLRPDQADFLTKHLRLTPDQIGEISRSEMSQATRAKVIQTGVKITSGLTESAHRKGAIQNSPIGRIAIPFLSVVNSTARGAWRFTGDLANDIKAITAKGATTKQRMAAMRNLGRSAWRMLSFAAAIAGSGFLQGYLRRGVTGRPLVDPEDPESWSAVLMSSLAEGGIFGPYYRMFEAAKYSNTLSELPTKLIFPISITVEVAMALLGEGRYEDSPWARRLSDLGAKLSPPWKAARNWIARLSYPSREDYNEARKLVWKYNKDVRGIEPRYGVGRKQIYLPIFEAIRDNDREALTEARENYWNHEAVKAMEPEDALRRLKSSLNSRRPINLSEEHTKTFLEKLPETARNRVLMEARRFESLMEKALLLPEETEDVTNR